MEQGYTDTEIKMINLTINGKMPQSRHDILQVSQLTIHTKTKDKASSFESSQGHGDHWQQAHYHKTQKTTKLSMTLKKKTNKKNTVCHIELENEEKNT